MRISDWSSDVCSSDLIPHAWPCADRLARRTGGAEDLVHSRQRLGMGACNATHQGPRTRRGTDLDVARITAAAPLGDQAVALAALHQRHRRLVAGLQAFGQLADRAPAAPVEAVQVDRKSTRLNSSH